MGKSEPVKEYDEEVQSTGTAKVLEQERTWNIGGRKRNTS